MFKCPKAYCILSRLVCDGNNDCPYGEDENANICRNKSVSCSGYFKCKNGYCLSVDKVCDGTVDCDGSADDERHCNYAHSNLECLSSPMVLLCHYKQNATDYGHIASFNLSGVRYLSININLYCTPLFLKAENLIIFSFSASNIKYAVKNGFDNLKGLRELHFTNNDHHLQWCFPWTLQLVGIEH